MVMLGVRVLPMVNVVRVGCLRSEANGTFFWAQRLPSFIDK